MNAASRAKIELLNGDRLVVDLVASTQSAIAIPSDMDLSHRIEQKKVEVWIFSVHH